MRGVPTIWPVAFGQGQLLVGNIPRRLHQRWTLDFALWTEASARLLIDTVRPRTIALQYCLPESTLWSALSSLLLSVPFSHTPRRAAQESTVAIALILW